MESKTSTCCGEPLGAAIKADAQTCCAAPAGRAAGTATPPQAAVVDIELFYLDLTTCSRCCGTEENLQAALQLLNPVLQATGAQVNVRKTHVVSVDQAQALGFVSSPTIRINGHDIAGQLVESACEDCSAGAPVKCRVWKYQGSESTQAPVGLIADAVLRAIYGGVTVTAAAQPEQPVPDNLKRYFGGQNAACCAAART